MGRQSKQKGASFERVICKALSLWITEGEKKDCFWRSAMSGGRATVAKGEVRQAGDICAVALEGHALTDLYYFELKHLKKIGLDGLIKGGGSLNRIWQIAIEQAESYGKIPVLIIKQNNWPVLVCTSSEGSFMLKIENEIKINAPYLDMDITLFDDLLGVDFKKVITDRPVKQPIERLKL